MDGDPKRGERADIRFPMGEFLPCFCDLQVDSEGRVLVFKMGEDPENGLIGFQVYAPDGGFLCESDIDRGDFELRIDPRFQRLDFTSRGIFGILPLRGDEMETPHLFRVRFRD